MRLIVLTCQDDLHTDAVIARLGERCPEAGVIRINTDNLSTNLSVRFSWMQTAGFDKRDLGLRDSTYSADSASVIWYRKPDPPPPHPSLSDSNSKECSIAEYKELLRSLPGMFPEAVWLNDFWQMQRFSVKCNQIPIAKAVGLNIPETIITNRLDAIKDLAAKYREIIVKPMAFNGFAIGSEQFGCYTNILTEKEIRGWHEETAAYAPAIYQQRIEKIQELRVTVVGEEVFACEIKTNTGTLENIDWRIQDVEDLPHRIVDLPGDIADRLKKMLKLMGLNFGAFDLIVDETGTYYFIEINPNGQYYWIELLTGAPLSDAVVSLILKLANKTKRIR